MRATSSTHIELEPLVLLSFDQMAIYRQLRIIGISMISW